MSGFNYQEYLLPALVMGFILWRWNRQRQARGKVPAMLKQGAVIVDVRSPTEFARGACPGSLNIPLGELERRSQELDKTRPVILCCASGGRSAMALGILKKQGFDQLLNAGPWTNIP